MSTPTSYLFADHGLAQPERFLRALKPGYVRFDERQLPEMLAYLTRIGEHIPFFDEKDREATDWGQLLRHDVSVLLALILTTDLNTIQQVGQELVRDIKQRYQPETDEWEQSAKFQMLKSYAQHMLEMPVLVQHWYEWGTSQLYDSKSAEGKVGFLLKRTLEQQMTNDVHKLMAYDQGAVDSLGKPLGLDYHSLASIWGKWEDVPALDIFTGKTLDEKLNKGLLRLQMLHRSMFDNLCYIVLQARNFFKLSIEQKSNHAPNMGLLITFLKLFRHAQGDLNGLLQAHLKFYYENVLQQKKLPPKGDRVYLCVDVDPATPELALPAGTRFDGGTDPFGQAIQYESLRPVVLNQTVISRLQTVFMAKDPKAAGGTREIVTGIYAAPVANSMDGQGKPFEDKQREWALFGEEQGKRLPDHKTMKQADVGFAVSSPVLFLGEGTRDISIDIQFLKSSAGIFEELLRGLHTREKEASLSQLFYEVFPEGGSSSLDLWLTGPNGWFRVDPVSVQIFSPDWEADTTYLSLKFVFRLMPGDPAVVGYRSAVHGETRMSSRFPVLRVMLLPTQPNPYSFLAHLNVSQVNIEVSVDQVRDVVVYNDLGQLDTAQPFQPFGPQPKLGSYFLIGNGEIFRKRLSDLKFEMEWLDLPGDQTVDSFKAYYETFNGYDFDPSSYQVRLSVLSAHQFQPEPRDQQRIDLFETREIENPNSPIPQAVPMNKTTLEGLNLSNLSIRPSAHLSTLPPYDNKAEIGYFKLELSAPGHAFGHQAYNTVFSKVAQENALKMNEGDTNSIADFPNAPYTPLLKSLTLSYSARGTVSMNASRGRSDSGDFFHILPFGTDKVTGGRVGSLAGGAWHLLPTFEGFGDKMDTSLMAAARNQGFLYIGLQGLRPPQIVTMLWQLSSRYTQSYSTQEMPLLGWSYMRRNTWQPLEEQALLEDGTDTFTRTGVISLQLPADMDDRNTVMPSGYYWLRVAVMGDLSVFCEGIEVHTQVVEASWVPTDDGRRLANPLPPGTVVRIGTSIPAVREIRQPYPSFGGRPEESDDAFFQRVSERLSHKQRAVSYRDYERIVLEAFPEIFQVKCLTHQRYPEVITNRGQVVLVVTPQRNSDDPTIKGLTPKVNFRMLQAIERFLKARVSPFADIVVRNPSYEYLRICAKVKFIEGHQNGYSLKRIEEDLIRYICPWWENADAAFDIGRSIQEDDILNFIKSLDYVKFITSFSIIHIFPEDEMRQEYRFLETAESKENVVILPQAWSILVPDDVHEIELTNSEQPRLADVRPTNRPVRFQRKVDLYKASDHNRHISRKDSLTDTSKMTTRTEREKRYSLKIKLT